MNKKGFVLDLDNTLWGGIVGDDGVENLMIGEETADAEAYTDFQKYLKEHPASEMTFDDFKNMNKMQ